MSYLSTLVATPPAAARPVAAAADPGVAAALEQHVEVDAAAPPDAAPATVPAAVRPEAEAGLPAGVADALQAAFAWVAPAPLSEGKTAPLQEGAAPVAAPEMHFLALAASFRGEPVELPAAGRGQVSGPATPQWPVAARAGTAPGSRPAVDRIDAILDADDPVALPRHEAQPRREPLPSRALGALAAGLSPSEEDRGAASQRAPQAGGVHVRIGSIALHVRTPPASPPPAEVGPAAAPAAAEAARQPSPAFAFSARRHHLRWS
jgi:hypothetical protein